MKKRFAIWLLAITSFAAALPAAAVPLNKCALIQRGSVGQETLINRCGECMKFKIERRRPVNNAAPSMRDYTLPAQSRQPLPFRGPGATRVVNEFPCKGGQPELR